MSPEALRDLIVGFLDDRKLLNIVSIDLAGKSSIADYMIVASGTSQRHIAASISMLHEELKKLGLKGVSVEGQQQCDWVLLDAGDVVVHVFRPEVRDFYNLEKMWTSSTDETDTPRPSRVAQS